MANASDRRAVQAARTRENAERRSELEQMRFLMTSPLGRRLAARILDMTGADRLGEFVPNAMTLAHDHGVRAMGFWLLGEIRAACPEQEAVMRREQLTLAQRADMQDEAEDADRNNAS